MMRRSLLIVLAAVAWVLCTAPNSSASVPDQVFQLDDRLVTLRQVGDTAQLSISRAQPGDLVGLTDSSGREWVAVVPPGADNATTPWVTDAVAGRARTVQGNQIVIEQATTGRTTERMS